MLCEGSLCLMCIRTGISAPFLKSLPTRTNKPAHLVEVEDSVGV